MLMILAVFSASHLTITLSRSQAPWDSNTWALSLRSDFSPRITAPYVGVGALDSMQNINPWLWSAFVLSLSGIFFRWVFDNTFVSFFLAVLLALAIVPLVKKIQRKN